MNFTYFKILSIGVTVFLLLRLYIDKPKNINLVKTDIYNGFVRENARYLEEHHIENKNNETLEQNLQDRTEQNVYTKKKKKKKKKKLPKSERSNAKERAIAMNNYVDYLKETCNGSEKLMSLKYISYLIRYMDITYQEKKILQDLVEQYIYSNIEHEKNKLSKLIDVYLNKEEDKKSKISFQNILYYNKGVESLTYTEPQLFTLTIFPFL